MVRRHDDHEHDSNWIDEYFNEDGLPIEEDAIDSVEDDSTEQMPIYSPDAPRSYAVPEDITPATSHESKPNTSESEVLAPVQTYIEDESTYERSVLDEPSSKTSGRSSNSRNRIAIGSGLLAAVVIAAGGYALGSSQGTSSVKPTTTVVTATQTSTVTTPTTIKSVVISPTTVTNTTTATTTATITQQVVPSNLPTVTQTNTTTVTTQPTAAPSSSPSS